MGMILKSQSAAEPEHEGLEDDGHGDRRGVYVKSCFFFGKTCRGTIAHYERPSTRSSEIRRCIRIELARLDKTGKISMEVGFGESAALLQVLAGKKDKFEKEIPRNGGKKTLQILRGIENKDTWVVVMSDTGASGNGTMLKAPFTLDTAAHAGLIVLGLGRSLYESVESEGVLRWFLEVGGGR